jgi:hypothetical protein
MWQLPMIESGGQAAGVCPGNDHYDKFADQDDFHFKDSGTLLTLPIILYADQDTTARQICA